MKNNNSNNQKGNENREKNNNEKKEECIELDMLGFENKDLEKDILNSITASIGSNDSGVISNELDSSIGSSNNIINRLNNISIEVNNTDIENINSFSNNINFTENSNNSFTNINISDNNTENNINNNNIPINNNEKNYIFGIKFIYPETENVVIIKKEEKNKFFWKWNKDYPVNLRDYIAKEDFVNDIELLNGLKRYYIFVMSLYSFWLLFFLVMIFVGVTPK
ncbi:expressed protein [Dictyostelium purpureum]|uniref:Expressed protein n=1 Tax=Dictyostelium purpureum TaxID=5786 RepID=F1A1M9_DICPU|nr:uncharacterized protein DICPUDRAFT_158446 [Dictyostelium purpureum]EGC29897.1 expressed protein [Dictyostelium purpureum]|eukprot:XP_003293575.1 expressed protein [Dictyostelium purpureum]